MFLHSDYFEICTIACGVLPGDLYRTILRKAGGGNSPENWTLTFSKPGAHTGEVTIVTWQDNTLNPVTCVTTHNISSYGFLCYCISLCMKVSR